MRLIDADALEKRMNERLRALTKECGYYDGYTCGFEEGCVAVEDAKTIDPESLRPQGRWVFAGDGIVECAVCSETYDVNMLPRNYCPNCGACMKGDNHGI